MAQSIASKVVIITGASSGIGAALALELASQGARLVLGARRLDKQESIAAACRAKGTEAIAVRCDVAHREDVQKLIQAAIDRFGQLDVVVANAGYGFLAKIQDVTDAEFDEIVAVNVKGSLYAMQEAAAVMRKKQAGHIILISSAAARRGLPLYGVYSMTKAAQLSLAEAMRVELRAEGGGVYVSTVHPITTATEFFETASQRSRIKSRGLGKPQTAELVARKIARLIRHPRPELWPHSLSRFGLSFATYFPRFGDWIMARMIGRRHGAGE